MPSFPDSVFAPANRANGQTIDASHMNGVQDEIVAIEGGYRNATAPLNSSNSTLANLSVPGGSTFAGSATFSAGVTFSTYTTQPVPSVALAHDAAVAFAAGAGWIGLDWNTEVKDAAGMHSTASNSSRITFAQSTGMYAVGASVLFNAYSTGGVRLMKLRVNDSTGVAGASARPSPGGGEPIILSASALVRVSDTTDYVTIMIRDDSGSTGSLAPTSTDVGMRFWAHKVSNL